MKHLILGQLGSDLSAVAVIMAGGSGTRFWPLSRTSLPKQFLPLAGNEQSLIQLTSDRVAPLVSNKGVTVVTAETQKDLVRSHLPDACVLVEPMPKNTAPCIGFAAKYILQHAGDIPMLCLPADHVVQGQDEILSVYEQGIELARREDALITIGVRPTHPETGYGYIKSGAQAGNVHAHPVYEVEQFVEKPDFATAESYVRSGNFFWNSGMFIWRPSVILGAITKLLPELAKQLDELEASFGLPDGYERAAAAYQAMPSVSIDTGVLEKAPRAMMLPGSSFRWSDVGSWSSWADNMLALSPNAQQNVAQGDVLLLDCRGCTVVGGKKLIAGLGLTDIVIIETDDALLVCRRDQSQDVKKMPERT